MSLDGQKNLTFTTTNNLRITIHILQIVALSVRAKDSFIIPKVPPQQFQTNNKATKYAINKFNLPQKQK